MNDAAAATDPPPMPDHRCLPAFDIGPWDWLIPPRHSFLLCASPRTGSTFVCEELAIRGLGEPLEYFNSGYVNYLCWRWKCVNLAQYRMFLWRFRTTADGNFGMKILGLQLFAIYDDIFAPLLGGQVGAQRTFPFDAQTHQLRRRQVESVAGDCTYVWLRRRDKASQAVSWWIAENTGLWMQKLPRDSRNLDRLEYDFDAIDTLQGQVELDDARWQAFFQVNGITPLVIDYEDVQSDPAAHIGTLAVALGGSFAPTSPRPDLRNHVQRNSATDQFRARYAADRSLRRAQALP